MTQVDRRSPLRPRVLAGLVPLAGLLVAPAPAAAAEELAFDPIEEFLVTPWVDLSIGPLQMGISKAVVYLWIAALVAIAVSLWIVRGGLRQQPGRGQTIVELLYSFMDTNIGQMTLPTKVAFQRWFPYVAALFVFVWTLNIISFLPLPFDTHNKIGPVPGLTIYAATSSLSVTLALALMSVIISHVEGVRANGVGGYLKSIVPPAPGPLKPFLALLEVMSHILRIVSLSVRLFANMFAGHLLIIVCLAFGIILGNVIVPFFTVPVAVAFYVFEFVLIASLQAYIFAMLSGMYIGSAIAAEH